MRLPLEMQRAVMLEELQELVLEGYPAPLLRALAHTLPLGNPVFHALRLATRRLDKLERRRQVFTA